MERHGSAREAAETDRLLASPLPLSDRKSYHQQDVGGRLIVSSVSILTLVFCVYSIMNSYSMRNIEVIPAILPPRPHVQQVQEVNFTSQVIIMRHCDKEVDLYSSGKKKKPATDMRDEFGNSHCNAKGKERSEYIATLFVEPEDDREIATNSSGQVEGTPPIPVDEPSARTVGSAAAGEKPQFPPPVKLYALSPERPKHIRKKKRRHQHRHQIKMKHRQNFREIDTVMPLANKFHLEVDSSFGVHEEVDLASEYFAQLNQRVQDFFGAMTAASNTTDPTVAVVGSQLRDGGTTIVNWKHSRIPLLARAFGCGKKQGCPKKYKGRDFDTMWLLTFQYSGIIGVVGDLDVGASTPAWESSSRHKKRKAKKKAHAVSLGDWKVTGELVKEGFERF